jgi:hypothetical protein
MSTRLNDLVQGLANQMLPRQQIFDDARSYHQTLASDFTVIYGAAQYASSPYRCLARIALVGNITNTIISASVINTAGYAPGGPSSSNILSAQQYLPVGLRVDSALETQLSRINSGQSLQPLNIAEVIQGNPNGPAVLANLCPSMAAAMTGSVPLQAAISDSPSTPVPDISASALAPISATELPEVPDSADFRAFVEKTLVPLAHKGAAAWSGRFTQPIIAGGWRSSGQPVDAATALRNLRESPEGGPARVAGISDGTNAGIPGHYALLVPANDPSFSRALVLSFTWLSDHWSIDKELLTTPSTSTLRMSVTMLFEGPPGHPGDFQPFPLPSQTPTGLSDPAGATVTLQERTVTGVILDVPDGWAMQDISPAGSTATITELTSPSGKNRLTVHISGCVNCGREPQSAEFSSYMVLDWRLVIPPGATSISNHGAWITYPLPDANGQPVAATLIMDKSTGGYVVVTFTGPMAATAIGQTVLRSIQSN